jgi:F0F1-type ATP synthase assembly protein I
VLSRRSSLPTRPQTPEGIFVDLRDKRELNRGFGDAMSRGFELAATTAIFGALGWWIDGRVGTRPAVMIVLVVLAVIGQFVKLWYAYDADMRRHESELPSRQTVKR